jgi:hypothetical protein
MNKLEQLANLAQSYKASYDNKQLSAAEFKELVEDLKIMENIQAEADSLKLNEQAYATLMAIVTLVGDIY